MNTHKVHRIPQKKSNRISFLFGEIYDDETHKMVESFAINYDTSFEKAKLVCFNFLIVEFGIPKKSNQNYYQSLYKLYAKKNVIFPQFISETYSELKNTYSKLIVTNNYVIDENTNQKYPFTDPQMLEYFGSRLGEDIGFEYLRFERY
jgi:hypothetical protein